MWGEVWYGCVLSSLTVKSMCIFIACFSHWLHWVLPVAEGRCHQIQDNFHHVFWPLSKMPSSWWVCGGGQVTACLPVCSWALLASSHASASFFFNIYAWFFLYICVFLYLCLKSTADRVHYIHYEQPWLQPTFLAMFSVYSVATDALMYFFYSRRRNICVHNSRWSTLNTTKSVLLT